jgi:pyridoxamine 5'-phosphate oxidase
MVLDLPKFGVTEVTKNMTDDQRTIRRDYDLGELRRANLELDPKVQFSHWINRAIEEALIDATAMTLATANAAGRPSVRIVLLKHFDERGFAWYTSYHSQKGRELAENPNASLLFHWRELERQVRISGTVTRLSQGDSKAYFESRPRESQYSAAASDQSFVIANRAALEAKVDALLRQGGAPLAMPEHWGGYLLQPSEYEFWQGRTGRLHDRFIYRKTATGWHIDRLQP